MLNVTKYVLTAVDSML